MQNELLKEDGLLINIPTMAANHTNQKEVEKASEKERSVCSACSQTGASLQWKGKKELWSTTAKVQGRQDVLGEDNSLLSKDEGTGFDDHSGWCSQRTEKLKRASEV